MSTPQDPLLIREFNASKQARLFKTLKQSQFSGQLQLKSRLQTEWKIFFYQGEMLYAVGGTHPIRRWIRNLAVHLPSLTSDQVKIPVELADRDDDPSACWEYELLCMWVEQHKITPEQALEVFKSTLVEVLFDITQTMQITCELKPNQSLYKKLALIDYHQIVEKTDKLWQESQSAKIADRYPDMAPVIKQPEQMQKSTSAQVYETLSQLLDGQHSLRDLAVQMRRNHIEVTRSLIPYIQTGLVELIPITDAPMPQVDKKDAIGTNIVPRSGPLIACVDDSPLICHILENIISVAGYRFVGVNDPLQAVEVLSAHKPDFIFLDLEMPHANGYEVCGQLRQIPSFRNTPIVILTGNDGIVDRVRAKIVGSSEFLNKPVEADVVLSVIRKYLQV